MMNISTYKVYNDSTDTLEGGTVPALQAVLGGAPDDVHHGAVLGAVARHQLSCRHQPHRATRGLARRPATIICRVDYTCNINIQIYTHRTEQCNNLTLQSRA